MLNKHKLFLLCAKWIPVVTAIGILVTNTIAYYGCNDIVVDIFNFNIGTSVAGIILLLILYIHSKKKFSLMEKTNCLLDVVKNQLQNAISNIDAGNSNLNEEEMEELVKTLSVLNKGVCSISR